jgi:hypothetical protein
MQKRPRSRFPPDVALAAASMKSAASAPASAISDRWAETKVSSRWEMASIVSAGPDTGLA